MEEGAAGEGAERMSGWESDKGRFDSSNGIFYFFFLSIFAKMCFFPKYSHIQLGIWMVLDMGTT